MFKVMTGLMGCCLMIVFPSLVTAYSMSGRVVRVDDGNTVTIVDSNNIQHTVRLQGVQAPGLNRFHGVRSRDNLQGMVGGRHVVIDYDLTSGYRTPTGRFYLGYDDVNLQQIQDGMARYKPGELAAVKKTKRDYTAAQEHAKAQARGIWYPPRKGPGPPAYKRRENTPPTQNTEIAAYPPMVNRPHFTYPSEPKVYRGAMPDKTRYIPLPDRRRVPYGRWTLLPKVPGGALYVLPRETLGPAVRSGVPALVPLRPKVVYPPYLSR